MPRYDDLVAFDVSQNLLQHCTPRFSSKTSPQVTIIIARHNARQNSTGASRLSSLLAEPFMDWHSSPDLRTIKTTTECRIVCGFDGKGSSGHLDPTDNSQMPRRLCCIDCQLQRTDQKIRREFPSSRDPCSIACAFSVGFYALLSEDCASL